MRLLAAALVAVALVVRDVTAEDDLNAVAAGDDPAKWKKRTRLFQQVVVGLDTMLERWDVASQVNRDKLAEANKVETEELPASAGTLFEAQVNNTTPAAARSPLLGRYLFRRYMESAEDKRAVS